jgi:hypothetical protein
MINDMAIPLNDFNQMYIGNILRGIATSLGYSGNKLSISLDRGGCFLSSEDMDVEIDNEYCSEIVKGTIRGMLSSLKGVFWHEKVTIITDE